MIIWVEKTPEPGAVMVLTTMTEETFNEVIIDSQYMRVDNWPLSAEQADLFLMLYPYGGTDLKNFLLGNKHFLDPCESIEWYDGDSRGDFAYCYYNSENNNFRSWR